MNWFQNFVSLWSETVHRRNGSPYRSCELVSKFCIFVIWNSITTNIYEKPVVVNWFQNFVSLWSETVLWEFQEQTIVLWIGFKILYLCDLKQCLPAGDVSNSCCELVSKFCIFVIWNSVNMQQNSRYQLWIGFKILYLCDLKQFSWRICRKLCCCELVSKFCIFVIWNSMHLKSKRQKQLWIGFKILYLCDLKQSVWWVDRWVYSCELVSKFCIFVIWNSQIDNL